MHIDSLVELVIIIFVDVTGRFFATAIFLSTISLSSENSSLFAHVLCTFFLVIVFEATSRYIFRNFSLLIMKSRFSLRYFSSLSLYSVINDRKTSTFKNCNR